MPYQEEMIKLLLSLILGGLIGAEREFHDKAAGLRTIIFICTGATLFTLVSTRFSDTGDPARVAAQIVTGVGFLGAGAILRDGARIIGLTTAATIWITAAIGMAIGAGEYPLAVGGTAAALLVLWVFPKIEQWLDHSRREFRVYELTCSAEHSNIQRIEKMFRDAGLHIRNDRYTRKGEEMVCVWEASGAAHCHNKLVEMIFSDKDIHEFRF